MFVEVAEQSIVARYQEQKFGMVGSVFPMVGHTALPPQVRSEASENPSLFPTTPYLQQHDNVNVSSLQADT